MKFPVSVMSEGDAFEKKGSLSCFFLVDQKQLLRSDLRKEMLGYGEPREFDVRCDTCPP